MRQGPVSGVCRVIGDLEEYRGHSSGQGIWGSGEDPVS